MTQNALKNIIDRRQKIWEDKFDSRIKSDKDGFDESIKQSKLSEEIFKRERSFDRLNYFG